MPKPPLAEPMATLEGQIVDTLLEGLRGWRPDLSYPESHSDMEACVRNLMRMFKVERSLKPIPLRYPCDDCDATGCAELKNGGSEIKTCATCKGRRWVEK